MEADYFCPSKQSQGNLHSSLRGQIQPPREMRIDNQHTTSNGNRPQHVVTIAEPMPIGNVAADRGDEYLRALRLCCPHILRGQNCISTECMEDT